MHSAALTPHFEKKEREGGERGGGETERDGENLRGRERGGGD